MRSATLATPVLHQAASAIFFALDLIRQTTRLDLPPMRTDRVFCPDAVSMKPSSAKAFRSDLEETVNVSPCSSHSFRTALWTISLWR